MNDIRRTLLWVVFSMSLVLLWDGWNSYNGKPSLFNPGATAPAAGATAAGGTPPASVPAIAGAAAVPGPAATLTTAGPAALAPVAPAGAIPAVSEKIVIATDVFRFTLDSNGGDPVKVELLREVDQNDRAKNVVLFDQTAQRVYLAQTGLIAAPGAAPLPTHLTGMTWVPGDRDLQPGSDELKVRFESPEVGGAKLAKTYIFKRGSYTVAVQLEVVNVSTAPITPQVYLQLVRDGNAPVGESSF